MNLRSAKFRWRLFTLAAMLSLLLFIGVHLGWYIGFDTPLVLRAGDVEATFASPTLRVHFISRAEAVEREQLASRAIIEREFERQRSVIDQQIKILPWRSNSYNAALAEYRLWDNAHKTYQRTALPRHIWNGSDTIVALTKLSIALALLPLIWSWLFWRRRRDAIKVWLHRRFRWPPAKEIGWLRRGRRVAFLGASLVSLLLAAATGVEWVRSHYVSDLWEDDRPQTLTQRTTLISRDLTTFKGGMAVRYSRVNYIKPLTSITLFIPMTLTQQSLYDYTLMTMYSRVAARKRDGPWQRFGALPPPKIPWYGGQFIYSNAGAGSVSWSCLIRWWVLLVLFSVPPALWFITHIRWRPMLRKNQCIACRYDLTGNVSGICPECGGATGVLLIGNP